LLALGWSLILVVGTGWFLREFDGFYIFLIYLAWLCFTSPQKIISELERIKTYTPKQIILIVIGLVFSVSVALGIILMCKYVMENILYLKGVLKIIVQYIVVIVALIPSALLFLKFMQLISKKRKQS